MTTVLLILCVGLVAGASWAAGWAASLLAHPSSSGLPQLPGGCYRMILTDGTSELVVVSLDELGPDHRAELEEAMAIVRRIADAQGKPEIHG